MTYEEIKRVYGGQRKVSNFKLTEKLYDVTRDNDFEKVLNSKMLLSMGIMDIPLEELFKKASASGHNYKYFIPYNVGDTQKKKTMYFFVWEGCIV